MAKIIPKLYRLFASKVFFAVTLVWFGLQASWIALSGLYPMAYDERFHFELIKIYAGRLHPFWSASPSGDAPFGPIARDTSYLYHFLMSWPYRIIEAITSDQRTQIILLRFSSIFFFIAGIIVFRKVLRRAGCSNAVSNVVLAIFAATPLVSLLAAQVNYDNLMFLVLAVALLLTQKILQDIKANKNLSTVKVLQLGCVVMAGSLIKYAFLPILLGIAILLGVSILRGKKHTLSSRTKEFTSGFKGSIQVVGLCILFLTLFGLCIERYGVNIVRYQTPTPECDQVLTIDQCMANGPWRRNYQTRQSKLAGRLEPQLTNPAEFTVKTWLSGTTYQLFYVLNGESSGYSVGWAFKIIRMASVTVFIIGSGLYIFYFGKLRKKYSLNPLLGIGLLYLAVLLTQNYLDLLNLGYPFGIQGRYLIPVLPIIYAIIATSFNMALGKDIMLKVLLSSTAVLFMVTQGGGAATFILRSDYKWYWDDSRIVNMNHKARVILEPFVIGK